MGNLGSLAEGRAHISVAATLAGACASTTLRSVCLFLAASQKVTRTSSLPHARVCACVSTLPCTAFFWQVGALPLSRSAGCGPHLCVFVCHLHVHACALTWMSSRQAEAFVLTSNSEASHGQK